MTHIQWLEIVSTFMLDNALGRGQLVNNGPALGVLLLGGPLFVDEPGPWASSITNQSELVKFAFGLLHLVMNLGECIMGITSCCLTWCP